MPDRRKRASGAARRIGGRSRPLYQSDFSKWYKSAEDSKVQRALETRFREGIKLVRQLYAGFDASSGFDLRHIRHWTDSRAETLNRFITEANRLTSGEFHELYTLHRPRSVGQRRALILHSGLVSIDEDKHPQKAWPVYANTRNVEIRYVKERIPVGAAMGRMIYEERQRAEIRRPVVGGALVHRDYLFREVLGFQPGLDSTTPEGLRVGQLLRTFDPWRQMIRAMQFLLPRLPDRTPKGNEAYYRLLSDRGPIGTSVPKHMLIERMQEWAEDYDGRIAQLLIGVRYQGDEFEAVRGPQSLDAKAERRRARYQKAAQERAKARGRIGPRGEVKRPTKSKPSTKSKRPTKPKRPPKPKRSAKPKRSTKSPRGKK